MNLNKYERKQRHLVMLLFYKLRLLFGRKISIIMVAKTENTRQTR